MTCFKFCNVKSSKETITTTTNFAKKKRENLLLLLQFRIFFFCSLLRSSTLFLTFRVVVFTFIKPGCMGRFGGWMASLLMIIINGKHQKNLYKCKHSHQYTCVYTKRVYVCVCL